MLGPKNTAADVAVLLEEGLKDGRIVLEYAGDRIERPRARGRRRRLIADLVSTFSFALLLDFLILPVLGSFGLINLHVDTVAHFAHLDRVPGVPVEFGRGLITYIITVALLVSYRRFTNVVSALDERIDHQAGAVVRHDDR